MSSTTARRFGTPGLTTDLDALQTACDDPDTPAETLRALADAHWNLGGPLLAKIAAHPNCSGKLLSRLAKRDLPVRVAVAGNPSAPRQVLKGLVDDPGTGIGDALASRHTLDGDLQVAVAEHGTDRARRILAGRADLTADAALTLVRTPRISKSSREMLTILARNPATTADVLAILAKQTPSARGVPTAARDALLTNPNLDTVGLQHVWARRTDIDDRDPSLAIKVVNHVNVDDALIDQLPARIVFDRRPDLVDGDGDASQLEWGLVDDFDGTVGELRELSRHVLTHTS